MRNIRSEVFCQNFGKMKRFGILCDKLRSNSGKNFFYEIFRQTARIFIEIETQIVLSFILVKNPVQIFYFWI